MPGVRARRHVSFSVYPDEGGGTVRRRLAAATERPFLSRWLRVPGSPVGGDAVGTSSVLPHMVPPQHLTRSHGLRGAVTSSLSSGSLAVGGLLVAWLNPAGALLVDGACFLGRGAVLAVVTLPDVRSDAEEGLWGFLPKVSRRSLPVARPLPPSAHAADRTQESGLRADADFLSGVQPTRPPPGHGRVWIARGREWRRQRRRWCARDTPGTSAGLAGLLRLGTWEAVWLWPSH